jgi:hypothetical protein
MQLFFIGQQQFISGTFLIITATNVNLRLTRGTSYAVECWHFLSRCKLTERVAAWLCKENHSVSLVACIVMVVTYAMQLPTLEVVVTHAMQLPTLEVAKGNPGRDSSAGGWMLCICSGVPCRLSSRVNKQMQAIGPVHRAAGNAAAENYNKT